MRFYCHFNVYLRVFKFLIFICCFILTIDISELDIEEIEPVVIEKINLMLGSSPYSYKVTLKDFHVHGLSNLKINQIK